MTGAVVGAQLRPVLVGGDGEQHLLAAGDETICGDLLLGPRAALARECFAKRDVGQVRVVGRELRWLVLYLVRTEAVGERHGDTSLQSDEVASIAARSSASSFGISSSVS